MFLAIATASNFASGVFGLTKKRLALAYLYEKVRIQVKIVRRDKTRSATL